MPRHYTRKKQRKTRKFTKRIGIKAKHNAITRKTRRPYKRRRTTTGKKRGGNSNNNEIINKLDELYKTYIDTNTLNINSNSEKDIKDNKNRIDGESDLDYIKRILNSYNGSVNDISSIIKDTSRRLLQAKNTYNEKITYNKLITNLTKKTDFAEFSLTKTIVNNKENNENNENNENLYYTIFKILYDSKILETLLVSSNSNIIKLLYFHARKEYSQENVCFLLEYNDIKNMHDNNHHKKQNDYIKNILETNKEIIDAIILETNKKNNDAIKKHLDTI